MPPVAARSLLGLSVLVFGTGAGLAKSPPTDRLGVVDTLIHEIQGDGLVSPLAGTRVTTQGVVTAVVADGYFLQTLPLQADADPATSEGVFVFTGATDPAVLVGQQREVEGLVEEARVGTSPHQLTFTRLVDTQSLLVASNLPLPPPRALTGSDLSPDADADSLERYEGMRVSASNLVVVGAAGAFIDPVSQTAESDGVVHAVWYTSFLPVPLPFREPGLSLFDAGTPPVGKTLPMHDGNPEVLRVESLAQPGGLLVNQGVETRLSNAVGVLGYRDARYSLLLDPVSPLNISPRGRTSPAILKVPGEVRLAWADLGDLYDASDDPARDEPVPSDSGYYMRTGVIAQRLCSPLGNPEVIAVRGVENLQVLRDLAARADTNPGVYCPVKPHYQPLLTEGDHPSGLDIGFLVSGRLVDGLHPRVQVLDAGSFATSDTSAHPAGGAEPLFAVPPLVARLRITDPGGRQFDFTAVNVQLQSQEGADSLAPGSDGWATEGERIMTLRARQAASVAAWLEARQMADPDEAIAVLGGFDADAFNDGRVDVLGIATGRAAPADETWVSLPSPVSSPLTNLTLLTDADQRYNANERGDFRALDHILVNEAMRRAATITPLSPRVNVHSPAVFRVNGGGSFSSRDPLLARLAVNAFADADTRVELVATDNLSPNRANVIDVQVANAGPSFAPALELQLRSTLLPAQWGLPSPGPGWTCDPVTADVEGSVVTCDHDGLAVDAAQAFGISIPLDPTLDGTGATFTATLTGGHGDPVAANNQSARAVTFNSEVDVYIELEDRLGDQYLLPGVSAGWNVAVRRTNEQPAGPVDVIVDIDAALDEVSVDTRFTIASCTGAATGERRSRFTCLSPASAGSDLAVFDIYFTTRPDDGGRVIGLTVQATSAYTDVTPGNNLVSDTRRVLDPVNLVAIGASLAPDSPGADNTNEATMQFGVYNAVDGIARNARVEVQVELPPEAIRAVETRPLGGAPDVWTCDAPQAWGNGSRIACRAPARLEPLPSGRRTDYFDIRFTAPYRPGLFSYPVGISVAASSDSDESSPANNVVNSTFQVNQSTDLSVGSFATRAFTVEPGIAVFRLELGHSGWNPPISPRVRIALNGTIPYAAIAVTDLQDVAVPCSLDTTLAGTTAVLCPYAVGTSGLNVAVTTNPALAGSPLTLEATVSNDRPESDLWFNRAVASMPIQTQADMCVGTGCSPSPTPYPTALEPDAINTLVYDVANLGPSTSRGQSLSIDVALPRARLSAAFNGQPCPAAFDTTATTSRVICPLPNVPGDGVVRQATVTVDVTGMADGTVPMRILVPGTFDPVLANNRLDFVLPIGRPAKVDLWAKVSTKPSSYPAPASFVVTVGADGEAHSDASRVILEINRPLPSGTVEVAGSGWLCEPLLTALPGLERVQCDRLVALVPGTSSRLLVGVPAGRFEQTGTAIQLTASHQFREIVASVDDVASNNVATATWIVDGRRTQSTTRPAEPTAAYGVRRDITPTPLRPQPRARAKD